MAKMITFPDNFKEMACDVFRLLSDKTRLGILMRLMQEEHSVGALCKALALPQPTVSHHLALMRMSRLIQKRRQGKQMIYSINVNLLRDLGNDFFKYMGAGNKSITLDKFMLTKKK